MRRVAALIAVAAIASGLSAWYFTAKHYEAALAKAEARHQGELKTLADQRAQAIADALQETARMKKERDDAVERATQRQAAQATAVASARAESERLRKQLSHTRARLATAPVEAVTEYAATVAELYGECEAELTETAAKADGHASDVQLMIDAWPEEGT